MVAWLQIAGRDGRNAILLTLVIVFLLLWADFRKPRYAFLAMIPLALGVFWMVGLMRLFGMMLNFMTLMGFPLIIGIGIDDGVHLLHRYWYEGMNKAPIVLKSTGKAILLTSLTTIAGFGSLMLGTFRGFVSLGMLLAIGVAACFLTTVLFLPAIIGLVQRDRKQGL